MVVKMGKYVTISAKIPEELREEIRALKINPSEVIREALENEVRKKKIEKLLKELENIKSLLTEPNETVKLIRETWDER